MVPDGFQGACSTDGYCSKKAADSGNCSFPHCCSPKSAAYESTDRIENLNMLDRTSAWNLLTEFTQSESLRKHALAVEACMRAYAQKFGEDEELWGVVGLIHDFDYEKFPSEQDHPFKGSEILKERGYSDEIRRAILSHADYSGVPRESPMEKALFACDELAGFITACALVKPGKSLAEVDAKSVRKKMKDKAFARSVSRDDIVNGARDLGVELDEHITFCIEAMKRIANELGLAGTADGTSG
jgi:putative nucleotidyltransferase with HDIG domain